MEHEAAKSYEFDDFRLDAVHRALLCRGKSIHLTPKVFELLLLLVRNSDRLMSKDELMRCLWPNIQVEESNLTQSIFLLRKALGQRPDENRLIVTIPGSGYRFTGEIKQRRANEASSHVVARTPREVIDGMVVQSLAVLPFRQLGHKLLDEYLEVGVADALISQLSKIRRIAVRPTSAILKYANTTRNPAAVGRELLVDFLLTGTLRRTRDRICVTTELIEARQGRLLSKATFEDEFRNLVTLQKSICQCVEQALTSASASEHIPTAARYTYNHKAYEAYLKGRHYLLRFSQNDWARSMQFFKKAIRIDSGYALAYAGLSDCQYIVSNLYLPPRQAIRRAKIAAQRAIELDMQLAEAHTSLALIHGFYEWNWTEAEREFAQAIELNPHYSHARLWHGRYLAARGKFNEALKELRIGQQLDPLSPMLNAVVGEVFIYSRQYRKAITQLRESLELESNFWPAHCFLGRAHLFQGHFAEAVGLLHRASKFSDTSRPSEYLAYAYALSGNRVEAEELLRELLEISKVRYVSQYNLALVYIALGRMDRAFHLIDRAYNDRCEQLVWLTVDPALDCIRSAPKFQGMLRKLGLSRGLDFRPNKGRRYITEPRPSIPKAGQEAPSELRKLA
jgi:DNA-binding winged helix-turn-helix (wHTH) protein/Tfp pilus assembly protein PilF